VTLQRRLMIISPNKRFELNTLVGQLDPRTIKSNSNYVSF